MPQHLHDENCRKMFALLSEYLDLELPSDACQEMDRHIAGCEPCAAFTESLRKTIDLCREYRPQELPDPIAHDTRRKLLEAYQKMLASGRS
jgi:RNA polymerase sigma-70 factor, ECF subfamily